MTIEVFINYSAGETLSPGLKIQVVHHTINLELSEERGYMEGAAGSWAAINSWYRRSRSFSL
jgi:hypothetical protein